MAPLVGAALGLVQYVPELLSLFGREDDAKTATKVLDVAKTITGKDDEAAAQAALAHDPKLQLEFKKALLEDKWVQERIDLDNVKSARAMYTQSSSAADRISKHVITYNLPLAILLFILNGCALYFFKAHAELMMVVGNMTGFLLNALLKERQDIINFHFGSSLGSKIKDFWKPNVRS